jgi:DNA (cytosine-5)-methyltransferase 1
MIPNHQAARLSDLDQLMASYVPPGGNWRDIPEFVPSARLAQIRKSAAAGEGSRSTYYGRLRPDRPAYTVSTYYNRPGNGCFLHYDRAQSRTISHREAARLQSFPDSFAFVGTQRSVCQQIGNAVPPLLGYQVAETLGPNGEMIDVFAGAGGLSLGFKWRGWETLAATDVDASAVATFNRNVAPMAFVGDMNDRKVLDRLLQSGRGKDVRNKPLALVGGPPCQGFSTGGNRRSEQDERNSLYKQYAALLKELEPDVFVFENVLGLLSMSGGTFLPRVVSGLRDAGYDVDVWRINAAEYGIPQRRQRVIIVGVPKGRPLPHKPTAWTAVENTSQTITHKAIDVASALDDLPIIRAGEDGSHLPYRGSPMNAYQRLMRGDMSARDFLAVSQDRANQVAA